MRKDLSDIENEEEKEEDNSTDDASEDNNNTEDEVLPEGEEYVSSKDMFDEL